MLKPRERIANLIAELEVLLHPEHGIKSERYLERLAASLEIVVCFVEVELNEELEALHRNQRVTGEKVSSV